MGPKRTRLGGKSIAERAGAIMIPKEVRRRAPLIENADEMRAFYARMGISRETTERAIAVAKQSPLESADRSRKQDSAAKTPKT
jgi:hypothetical protein